MRKSFSASWLVVFVFSVGALAGGCTQQVEAQGGQYCRSADGACTGDCPSGYHCASTGTGMSCSCQRD